MGRSITKIMAVREGNTPLEYAVEHDDAQCPTREDLAFQLVLLAQDRHTPLIPPGERGASREQRLREFGYAITSVTTDSVL